MLDTVFGSIAKRAAVVLAMASLAALSSTRTAYAAGLAAPATVQSLPDITPEAGPLDDAHAVETATGDPDEDATLAAANDARSNGIQAIAPHEAALRKVLADMPQPFTRTGTMGGKAFYRADSMADCIAYATASKRPKRQTSFVCKGNPYAAAGFYLGSYLNEMRRPADALVVLDLGLIAAPNSPELIGERSAALIGLHRVDDVLANADRGLAIANLADEDRARLYRNRGYALTELHRLDEAEQAYRASLKLQPDNTLAHNELTYIARLRAGGAQAPGGMLPLTQSKPQGAP